MPLCKSGRHEWLDPDSAKLCCNGYRRYWTPDVPRFSCIAPTPTRDGGWYYWEKKEEEGNV